MIPASIDPGQGTQMRNAASLWWETALLSVGESWAMRTEEPSREDGAGPHVGS